MNLSVVDFDYYYCELVCRFDRTTWLDWHTWKVEVVAVTNDVGEAEEVRLLARAVEVAVDHHYRLPIDDENDVAAIDSNPQDTVVDHSKKKTKGLPWRPSMVLPLLYSISRHLFVFHCDETVLWFEILTKKKKMVEEDDCYCCIHSNGLLQHDLVLSVVLHAVVVVVRTYSEEAEVDSHREQDLAATWVVAVELHMAVAAVVVQHYCGAEEVAVHRTKEEVDADIVVVEVACVRNRDGDKILEVEWSCWNHHLCVVCCCCCFDQRQSPSMALLQKRVVTFASLVRWRARKGEPNEGM